MTRPIRRHPDTAWLESEAGGIVACRFTTTDASPRILQDSAADIWRALEPSATREEVIARLAEAYGLEPAQIENDVMAFVDDLVRSGLVEEL